MKELSIEQKVKAYDNIIEKANKMHRENCEACQMCIEELIPELKESEDERIRKSLCKAIWTYIPTEEGQEYIAWLEKQGEQKPVFEMKTPEESLGIDSDTYNKIVDECIYGEQKPTDKVEPKFKIGDWLVHKEMVGITCCITQIHAPHYYLTNNNSFIKFGEEYNYRPWTIEDAKDGDVLSYRDGQWIFIYKGIVTEDTFKYYALLSEKGITVNDAAFSLLTSCIVPATKEQRDLLFQKMKEAGYVWDAEKKELKKIESRQEELTEFEKAVKQVMEEAIECGDTHNLKADADMLLRLVQKPAWSEEDTKMVESIITDIKYCKKAYNNYSFHENEIGWLKSLKDRVQSQPKQEWSEEDEKMLKDTIRFCELCGNQVSANWLKSLRPQNTWKPSDEQMETLWSTTEKYLESDNENVRKLRGEVLESLYEDLKKLMKE